MIVGAIVLVVLITKLLPGLAGTVLCLLMLGVYYGVIYRSLRFCNVNFRDELINDLPRILLMAALATGFIVFMINSQHTIYTSDSLETWEPTLSCDEKTFTDPYRALKDLRWSINHTDYNNFLPMLMALPMHIFGRSFLCYELYVWIMFALPAIFIASATFKHYTNVNLPCSALMAIIFCLPAFQTPVFLGYANVSILLPGAVIFAMLLNLDKSKLQREQLILIAMLCIFAVFQARTASYMLLGEFLGYTLYLIISSFQERTLLGDLIRLLQKFLFIGVCGLILTLPFFFPFIKHALTYDIGTAYAAYSHGYSFSTRLLFHAGHLGLLIYVLFLIGVIVNFRDKKLSSIAAFFLIWAILPAVLICHVQIMDKQHFYTMILPFAFGIALLTSFVWERKKFLAAMIFILAFNFLQTYCAPLNIYAAFNERYNLLIRHDIEDFKKFVADINQLSAGKKKVYALTSNGLYNGHSFSKLYLPDNHDALPGLLNIAEVDLGAGFPIQFFDADIVLVPEPLQLHLRPQDQSVVVKPAELMLKPSPISKHFKKVKEYTFRPETHEVSSVTFKVYEKISPFEKSDIDFVEKIFVELYPEHDELFKNRFEQYKLENFKE